MAKRALGIVTQGSLSRGLEMRLGEDVSVEDLRVGSFVVVEGRRCRFFAMLTDVELGVSDAGILAHPPEAGSLLAEAVEGTGTYALVRLQPMLMLSAEGGELRPVKTVPGHFSPVCEASEDDFALVFGREEQDQHLAIGTPPDMAAPVCLDLSRFVERSNAVFGKSGTGKSFLTRLLLAGTIQREACVNLVFDMHSEYGWQARSEGRGMVKGLKQLFGSRVALFTLDPESSRRRGLSDAEPLFIGLDQITIGDLALLAGELNLTETAVESALVLKEALGTRHWLSRFLAMAPADVEALALEGKGHAGALKALQRKLLKLRELAYVKETVEEDAVDALLKHIEQGRHVVLEFGTHNHLLSYMLAANVLTRRLHGRYVSLTEAHQADPSLPAPRQLMITLEEAHKFLAPGVAHQTIFGTIAREMRKYFVTLLIVDQRPSGIEPEILSQVGTRVTALLNDEKDIDAVFTGVAGAPALRTVLSQLDAKQQALLLGYATPMPVVIRVRDYDEAFYRAMGVDGEEEKVRRGRRHMATLWGPK